MNTHTAVLTVCGALALLTLSPSVSSQAAPEILAPSNGDASDVFGHSVDVDGTRAVVGAPFDGATNVGAAYVYDWDSMTSTWVEAAKLTPTPSLASKVSQFGFSVAIAGTRVVVGAPYSDIPNGVYGFQAGVAYVFEESGGTWSQVAELTESTRYSVFYPNGAQLGTSVDIEGDTIVVGQPAFSWLGIAGSFGSVNVYQAPFAGVMDEFAHLDRRDLGAVAIQGMAMGQAVALSGDTIVAGAASDDSHSGPGRVFVFELLSGDWSTGTINHAVLTNSDPEIGAGAGTHDDQYGRVLDFDGATVAVGAYDHSVGAESRSGKVYLFEKVGSTWSDATETVALTNGGSAGRFGHGIAIDDATSTLLIGDDLANSNKGAGYVYRKIAGIWTSIFTLTPPQGASPQLGFSAAMDGDHKILGAPYTADVPATPHGVAWDWNTPLFKGSVTIRNGSFGINPVSFAAVLPPVIGENWDTTIDIATPGAIASVVGISLGGSSSGFVLNGNLSGELLVALSPPLLLDVSGGAHAIAVPLDTSLVGLGLSTQGATFFPGDIRLTNALDVVFGTY